MIILPILTASRERFPLEGWENLLFERGSERVNRVEKLTKTTNADQRQRRQQCISGELRIRALPARARSAKATEFVIVTQSVEISRRPSTANEAR